MILRGCATIAFGALLLASCTSSSSHLASPETEQSVAATASRTVRYVALGDSYTIGTGVAPSERWPDRLVAAVRDRVPLQLVANLGVNGYTSEDLIRFELPQVAELEPEFVTLLIGVNDVVQRVTLERYRANVQHILATLLEQLPPDRIVVVSTPDYTRTPRGADFGAPERQRAAIGSFNEAMAALSAERRIAFVDITVVADAAEGDPSLVADDLLHPSGEQYRRWVQLIAPVVEATFAGRQPV